MIIKKLKNFNKSCTIRYDEEAEGLISFDGGVFKLNDTSYDIVMLLENGKKYNEIIQYISEKYGVSKNEVEEDVSEFLNELNDLGLHQM